MISTGNDPYSLIPIHSFLVTGTGAFDASSLSFPMQVELTTPSNGVVSVASHILVDNDPNRIRGVDPVSGEAATFVLNNDGTVTTITYDGTTRTVAGGVAEFLPGIDPITHLPTVFGLYKDGRVSFLERGRAAADRRQRDEHPAGLRPRQPRARRDRAAWRWYGQRWGSDGLRPEDSGVQQIVAGYDPVARIPAVNVWHTDGTVSTWGSDGLPIDGNVTNILPGYDPVSLVPAVIVLHGDGTVSRLGQRRLAPEDSGVQQIVAGYDPVARIPAVNVWHTDGTVSAWGSDGFAPIDGRTNIRRARPRQPGPP